MANLPLAADNKTYLGFLVCERNFAWAFLTLRAHLSDSPRLTGRSNGAAGGGGNIGWYAIRLQILTANTQLTSVELFANCRLDWSLLKTMVDC